MRRSVLTCLGLDSLVKPEPSLALGRATDHDGDSNESIRTLRRSRT